MKTGQQWFEEFPEPIKSMALKYATKPHIERESVRIALICDIVWKETEQGQDFWLFVYLAIAEGKNWDVILSELEAKFPEIMDKYKKSNP